MKPVTAPRFLYDLKIPFRFASLRDELKLVDQLIIVVSALAIYIAVYFGVYALTGRWLTGLVLLPVLAVAWFYGPLAGSAAAFAGWGIDILIQIGAGQPIWSEWQTNDIITYIAILLTVGCMTGMISYQDRNMRRLKKASQTAQEEYLASLALVSDMLAVSNEGLAVMDAQGKVLRYNRKFSEMWALSDECSRELNMLEGERFLEALVADPEAIFSRIRQIFRNPYEEFKFEIKLRDRRVIFCESFAWHGHPGGVVLRFTDITDWEQTKEALYEREQYLRLMINHASEGLLLLSEQGSILEWNDAMERLTGLKWEEVFHRPMAEVAAYLVPGNQRKAETTDKIQAFWDDLVRTGEFHIAPGHNETIYRRTDGKRSVVEITAIPVQTDQGYIAAVFYRDLTDRKRVEDSLREQVRISRNILNASPDMAALVDIAGNVIAANQALADAAGLSCETLMGHAINDLLPPAVQKPVGALMRKVIHTANPYYTDCQSSGQYFSLTVYPVSIEAGKTTRLVLFLRNITESRQRERELEAVASISSALRAAITRAEVYPIILDQIETLLKADGVGLVLRDANTREVRVEQARGGWTSLLGTSYTADQANRAPIMIMEEPYFNNFIENEQHLFHTQPFKNLKATACVPLQIEGQILGSLWIGRKTMITKEDLRILSALAHITASALHRSMLYENTRQYAEQVAYAAEVGKTLTETLQLEEIYNRLAHALLKMLPNLCTVMILRYNSQRDTFTYAYALHDGSRVEKEEIPSLQRFLPGDSAFTEIVRTRRPLVINDLKRDNATRIIAVELNARSGLFAPLVSKGEVLGILQVHSYEKNRFTDSDVEMFALIGNTAAIAFQNAHLFEDLHQSHEELTEAYEATLDGWARALDLRDSGTSGHTRRVVELAVELGRFMGLSHEKLVLLRRGALLHDIGKMGVPDDILKKTGPLTDSEWVMMRNHTTNAYSWLSPIPFLKPALDIPYCHHEKWDGSGYPRGLAGEEIPLAARIFAVVDVWDALLSDRPYRKAWAQGEVVEYMRQQRGKYFDPKVVDAFLAMVADDIKTQSMEKHSTPYI
jgi:PAS domain S-box-containing protein